MRWWEDQHKVEMLKDCQLIPTDTGGKAGS